MKKTKKIFALLLTLIMTLTMSVATFAATITIKNPASGETYTAYKLFDVVTNEEETKYSYSTDNEELVKALTAEESNLGIVFSKAASDDIWYVSGLNEESDAAVLAQYIHNNWTNTFKNLLGTGTAANVDSESGVTSITVNNPGYYFVTSSLGSLCALDTATTKAEINEKNSIPSITKKVKEDSTNSFGESATIDVIDTVYYQLTVNTGSNTNTNGGGTGVDGDYVITDVLPDGIVYNDGSVAIDGWVLDTDYTVKHDKELNTLTIKLLSSGKLSNLAQNIDIVITYNAKVTKNLTVGDANKNKVTLTYKLQTSEDEATVYTYGIGGSKENSTITKIDGTTKQPLAGVKFVLSKGSQYATFDENGYLKGWVNSKDDATKLSTDSDGHIYAYGLDADTYVLTETETLPGYNLLADTITVVISETGDVTYQYTSEVNDNDDDANPGSSIIVENNSGSELPSTGGMGTTVIYILGAALVLGAGIVLVVRRRMSADR